jgi:hypothetical protein
MYKYKDATGASMMEMVLYVGIMAVVAAGVFKLYAEASEKAKRVEIQNQIPDIIKKVNVLYAGRAIGSAGLENNKNANTDDYLTKKNIKLTHPWSAASDAITVTWVTGNTAATTITGRPHMKIAINNLPKASCIWLVSAMTDTGVCTTAGTTDSGNVADTNCIKTPEKAVDKCDGTTNSVYVRARKE